MWDKPSSRLLPSAACLLQAPTYHLGSVVKCQAPTYRLGSVMKYLGSSLSVLQSTFTGRPTCRRAVANGPNDSSANARSSSPIDESCVLAYTMIFSREGKISEVNKLPLPFIGGPEGVVASGSASGSCAGRGFMVDFWSISATSVDRSWCNRSTFTLWNSSKNLLFSSSGLRRAVGSSK